MEERALLFIQTVPVKTVCPFQQLRHVPVRILVQIREHGLYRLALQSFLDILLSHDSSSFPRLRSMLSEYTFIVEMQDSKSTVRLHATVKKLR